MIGCILIINGEEIKITIDPKLNDSQKQLCDKLVKATNSNPNVPAIAYNKNNCLCWRHPNWEGKK